MLCKLLFSGPYWSLLGSQVHYLDFYLHVERLHTALHQWQQDATPVLQASCLPGHQFSPQCCHFAISACTVAVGDEKTAAVKCVLEKMCAAMLTVTKRQLADFSPEPKGRYHNIQDPQLRTKLAH